MKSLEELRTRWQMEERGGGNASWMWMMRERQENARGNDVHSGLTHQDFTLNTTRREIVSFYEKLYSDLVEVAQTLEAQRDHLLQSVSAKGDRIRALEEERNEISESWSKAFDRFETIMDILVQSRKEE